jgi:hypothetical protein
LYRIGYPEEKVEPIKKAQPVGYEDTFPSQKKQVQDLFFFTPKSLPYNKEF